MTTTTDWPTGSSDHAASNVKTATIIQFVPRANPNREQMQSLGPEFSKVLYDNLWEIYARPTDCGNLGHPWSGEDKA